MSANLNKVFAPLTPNSVEVLSELNQLLFKSYFFTIGSLGK